MISKFPTVARALLLASPFVMGSVSVDRAYAAPASEHSLYPGSDSAAAQQSRSRRDAPNMYCEKHENYCN